VSVGSGAPGGRRIVWAFIWSGVAGVVAIGALYLAFRNLDLDRLFTVLRDANMVWIIALSVSIPLEQLLRGWKWRQILFDLRPISSIRLFGAVMAGYFINMLVPVGLSPLVRAWLVARLEGMAVATVLVTTAIERFIDGIVFSVIVGVLIIFAVLPALDGDLQVGLMVAGAGTLVVFASLFGFLFRYKHHLTTPHSFIGRNIAGLEKSFGGKLAGLGDGLSRGVNWPKSHARGAGVVAASIAMKLISTSHFLWAGLAFGVVLAPSDYLFVMVFTSFALIMSRFIRVPGGAVIGSAFALKLLGVADEEALTMVLVVHTASLLLVAGIGAFALGKSGLTIVKFRRYIDRKEA